MRLPGSSSGRVLVAAWWLFCIVMGATYSGNLIAFLTVRLEVKPFHSLQQMLDQDTYVWGAQYKTATYQMLVVRSGSSSSSSSSTRPPPTRCSWCVVVVAVVVVVVVAVQYRHLPDARGA